MNSLSVLELCAGAGGLALGLEQAGFAHAAAVENDRDACATLRLNRHAWNVLEQDVRAIDGQSFRGMDLLAAGVPCPPFSVGGRQLGAADARDLFPDTLRIIEEARPRAVLIENVRGILGAKFREYFGGVLLRLTAMRYTTAYRVLNASDYGVPQLRPRLVIVALMGEEAERFRWPTPRAERASVGATLSDLIAERGWPGAAAWEERASNIAPTLVGGSKKHGGADLGPTRARLQWAGLGVDGRGLADAAPGEHFPTDSMPRLTLRMAARIQGFPDAWHFSGRKTAVYRQIGNAFPPPVARAIGSAMASAFGAQPQLDAYAALASHGR